MPKEVVNLYSTDPYVEKKLFIYQLNKNYEMLKNNYDELRQQFAKFHDKEVNQEVWNSVFPDLDNMIFNLSRRLFNFVSLAKALVEVNRILIRKKFNKTKYIQKYQTKVDFLFANNPLVKFIEGMRNYSLHYKLPIPNVKPIENLSNDEIPRKALVDDSIVLLKKKRLLEWDRWEKEAKEYLNSLEENIDIEKIINEYFKCLEDFYDWLFKSLEEEL